MSNRIYEALLPIILWPVLLVAKATSVKHAADAQADVYRRAQQAEDEGMPDLARQLRDYAATLGITTSPEANPLLLPEPAKEQPALPAPRKPGRPGKEERGQ